MKPSFPFFKTLALPLINGYMAQPNTVILAVIPANQDVATIDILERASAADPEGIRTLGVLTKVDLVDEGAEDEYGTEEYGENNES